jgi:hypothetical protein
MVRIIMVIQPAKMVGFILDLLGIYWNITNMGRKWGYKPTKISMPTSHGTFDGENADNSFVQLG